MATPPEGATFFVPDGDAFVATEHARGPWHVDFQHGGPPGALIGRAVERAAAQLGEWSPARFTLTFLRPVPIAALEVAIDVTRQGRSVCELGAVLRADGVDVLRADALMIRRTALTVDGHASPAPETSPEGLSSWTFPFFVHDVGYHCAMDVRPAGMRWGSGPVFAWLRARIPLLPGEELSPLQRVLLAADSVHGVSPPFASYDDLSAVNPDLTVALHRLPEGEWIGMDACALAGAEGVGTAQSTLSDRRGAIGGTLQTLLIDRRR